MTNAAAVGEPAERLGQLHAACPRSSRARRPRRRGGRDRRRPATTAEPASTSSGARTAAEPMTTRATPASASASRIVDGAHAATGLHLRPPRDGRGDGGDHADGSRGEPERAASRSTTWIHVAPCVGERRGDGDGIVAVRGLLVVVALEQPHHLAVAQVDRRDTARSRRHHRPPPATTRTKLRQQRQTRLARLLRVELGGEHVALPERGVDRAAVVARGRDHRRVGRARRAASARSTPTAARRSPANIGSSRCCRSSCSWFHCICGRGSWSVIHRMRAGDDAEPRAVGSSSLPSNSICMPTQMPRNGRPDADRVVRPPTPDRRRAAHPCMRRTLRRRAARRRRRRPPARGRR